MIWLPFSLFNLIADQSPGFFGENENYYFIFVQLFGLTSTVTNPVLYAFFNEHFQREFKDGIKWTKVKVCGIFFCGNVRHSSSKNSTLRVQNTKERIYTEQVEMVIINKPNLFIHKKRVFNNEHMQLHITASDVICFMFLQTYLLKKDVNTVKSPFLKQHSTAVQLHRKSSLPPGENERVR